MVLTRSVRYGTALCPSLRRLVPARFPNERFRPVKPSAENLHPFEGVCCTDPAASLHSAMDDAKRKYAPSVSFLLSCTNDKMEYLYQWQLRMMRSMGEAGFRAFIKKRMESGTDFHNVLKEALGEMRRTGSLPAVNEDYVQQMREKGRIRHFDEVMPFIRTMQPVLELIQPSDSTRVEERVKHSCLFYGGRIDAILDWGGKPTLVDWKTIYSGSSKSQLDSHLITDDLFSDPMQVSAYVGAVNADPRFFDLPSRVKQGALVCVFEDGREPQVVMIGEEELEHRYQEFLKRVNLFWWRMENPEPGTDNEALIDFVYNPLAHASPEEEGVESSAADVGTEEGEGLVQEGVDA